ncbi:ADP-ribosyltransferase domain-containing protein [Bdellovibrio sp. HCB290]|uniref:ADP-ribosyltransferase domain-containing protein n=1 Tax=Bdellovibrio sp. HCB290 TaxID=3394356 RepID=UPI0039B43CBE
MKTLILVFSFLSAVQAFAISDQEFADKYCVGNCENKLMVQYDPTGPISAAEHFLIQKYTETYAFLDAEMFIRAVEKIPVAEGTFYRGLDSKRSRIRSVGQIVELRGITSVSGERSTAENFIKDQLFIIHGKSAHSISRYSVMGEQESILLPGVQLRVDKIYEEQIDLGYQNESNIVNVQVVELTEI